MLRDALRMLIQLTKNICNRRMAHIFHCIYNDCLKKKEAKSYKYQ